MRDPVCYAFLAVFLGHTAFFPAYSQDPVPQPSTTGNAQIPLDQLALLLRPLTKDQLLVEANGWRDLLQLKSGEVIRAAVRSKNTEISPAEKVTTIQQATALADERQRLVDRLDTVLSAVVALGAEDDVKEFRAYIARNSGQAIPVSAEDVKDPSLILTTAKAWVTSQEGGRRWGLNILKFLVVLILFKIAAGIVGRILAKALSASRLKISDLLRKFITNSIRNVIFFVGVVIALKYIGLEIGPLLAALGVVGFVIGFALQDTLSNFAAGFMILLYRPYDVGDFVTAAGVTGKVDAMSLVSTTLLTPDNQNVIVPNGSIWGGVITNVTGNSTRRVDMIFGIGYEDDISKAQGILEDIIKNHPLVMKEPEPIIKLHELADSSVNFVCRPWASTSDYWSVYWDVTRAVKDRFDAEGISIPFPQQDVHLHKVD